MRCVNSLIASSSRRPLQSSARTHQSCFCSVFFQANTLSEHHRGPLWDKMTHEKLVALKELSRMEKVDNLCHAFRERLSSEQRHDAIARNTADTLRHQPAVGPQTGPLQKHALYVYCMHKPGLQPWVFFSLSPRVSTSALMIVNFSKWR